MRNPLVTQAIMGYNRNEPGSLLSLLSRIGPLQPRTETASPTVRKVVKPGRVTAVIGDSIAVSGGRAFGVKTKATGGIGSGPGINQIRGLSGTVVVSLGANDDPRQGEAFRQRIRRAMRLAPNARLVWATVPNRPGFNKILRQEAARSGGRLTVADTSRVRTADGVHPYNPRDWVKAVKRSVG